MVEIVRRSPEAHMDRRVDDELPTCGAAFGGCGRTRVVRAAKSRFLDAGNSYVENDDAGGARAWPLA